LKPVSGHACHDTTKDVDDDTVATNTGCAAIFGHAEAPGCADPSGHADSPLDELPTTFCESNVDEVIPRLQARPHSGIGAGRNLATGSCRITLASHGPAARAAMQ
jgi:hypothetical protein